MTSDFLPDAFPEDWSGHREAYFRRGVNDKEDDGFRGGRKERHDYDQHHWEWSELGNVALCENNSDFMTLCLAWKLGKNVWFASDSRLSVGGDKGPFCDLGIKICAIPVEIFSIEGSGIEPRSIFKADYGLAFSGNMTSAYLLREMLANILSRLQWRALEVPFEAIVKVVLIFYRHYLKELFKTFHNSGDYRFFLGGFCPASKKLRVYKFDYAPEPSANEVLLSHPFAYDCIGSGEGHFRKFAAAEIDGKTQDLNKKMFYGLRDVINAPTAPDVGGLIQTGTFDSGTFRLYGVLQHDFSGERPQAIQAVGGLSLENVYDMEDAWDLHIRSSLMAPFQDDLLNL